MSDILAPYREPAEAMRAHVEGVLAGTRVIQAPRPSTVAWVATSLLADEEEIDLAELLFRMDASNKLMPNADDVAGGLLALKERGWLRGRQGRYGLAPDVAEAIRATWARVGLWEAWREFEARIGP